MTLGLAIGKFLPPHRGHGLLFEAAMARCDEVVVVVCDASWHEISPEQRAGWISESYPGIRTVTLDQDALALDDDDSQGWAQATVAALGRAPHVVFTSEEYGPRYAGFMGAEHVMVDPERRARPIRASLIRERPQAHLDWLDPHVRAHHVARVCVLGAESTGKTTLARQLAGHYGVGFVGEFGRFYCEAMPDPPRYTWRTADFHLIAQAQAAIEDDAARWSAAPLVCDTNPFVTAVFHEAYLGSREPALEEAGRRRRYDLFVLCDPATPFVQDGTHLRVDGDRRVWMHERLREYAEASGAPVLAVSGSPDEREQQAVEAIDRLLAAGPH